MTYQPTWITREMSPKLRRLRPSAQAIYLELAAQPGFSGAGWRGSERQLSIQTGHHRKTIHRALGDLVRAGLVVREPMRWKWSRFRLPDEARPSTRSPLRPQKSRLVCGYPRLGTIGGAPSVPPNTKKMERGGARKSTPPLSVMSGSKNKERARTGSGFAPARALPAEPGPAYGPMPESCKAAADALLGRTPKPERPAVQLMSDEEAAERRRMLLAQRRVE